MEAGVSPKMKGFEEVGGSPLIMMPSFYREDGLHTDTLLVQTRP